MKKLILIICVFVCTSSSAQENLIRNPGFEEYYNCDFDIRDRLDSVIASWHPLVENPEYHHVKCRTFRPATEVMPLGGEAYVALASGDVSFPDSSGWQVRSYISSELKRPLRQGATYYLEYYVSAASDNAVPQSHFGIHFSDTLVYEPFSWGVPYYPLLIEPHLEVDTIVGEESTKWYKIHHCFVADQDYSVITAGVFASADEVKRLPSRYGLNYTAYDNFYLAEILPKIELNLSQTDTICEGSCLKLWTSHSDLPTGTWNWVLPGSHIGTSNEPIVEACYDSPGTYNVYIQYDYECQSIRDTFLQQVVVVPKIEHEPKWRDTLVCDQSVVQVDIDETGFNAAWLDGFEQGNRLLSEGTYPYSLDNGYCSDTFSLTVNYLPEANQEVEPISFCKGDTLLFDNQKITQPQNFIDTLYSQQGCDSVFLERQIRFYPSTPWEWEGDLGYCPGKQTEIKITSNLTNITWNGESKGSSALLGIAGTVHLIGRDGNGCRTDTLIEIIEYPVPEVTTENLLDILFTGPIDLPVRYNGDILDYHWSPSQPLDCVNCPYPQLTRAQEGNYYITVTNREGCEVSETLEVRFKEAEIYFPNVIRVGAELPANGRMMMYSNFPINYDLVIFDRWGGSVYQADDLISDNPRGAWQPTQDTHLGVYTFMAKFQVNGETIVEAGTVTLIN